MSSHTPSWKRPLSQGEKVKSSTSVISSFTSQIAKWHSYKKALDEKREKIDSDIKKSINIKQALVKAKKMEEIKLETKPVDVVKPTWAK